MNGMIADEGAHGYVVIGSSSICYTSTLDTHKCLYSPDNDLSAAPLPNPGQEALKRPMDALARPSKRGSKKTFFSKPSSSRKIF
jgi:hypothetical protein